MAAKKGTAARPSLADGRDLVSFAGIPVKERNLVHVYLGAHDVRRLTPQQAYQMILQGRAEKEREDARERTEREAKYRQEAIESAKETCGEMLAKLATVRDCLQAISEGGAPTVGDAQQLADITHAAFIQYMAQMERSLHTLGIWGGLSCKGQKQPDGWFVGELHGKPVAQVQPLPVE